MSGRCRSSIAPVRTSLAALLALLMLAGCVSTGDFGRVRPSLQRDDMHAWMGAAASPPLVEPPWHHQLTDHERQLRDLAFALIDPPFNRSRWTRVLAHYGADGQAGPYPDRAGYASRLFQTAYRSQTARYNKLIEDVRNDVVRIDPFFSVARYVADMDRRREQGLVMVSALTDEERGNTLQRIRENEAVVRWVQGSLIERAAAYQVALERLVIAAPSPNAVEAERSLTLLRQRIAATRV